MDFTSRVTDYWLAQFGCSEESLFSDPLQIVSHSDELNNYNGVLGVFRSTSGTLSFPPEAKDSLLKLLPSGPVTAHQFAEAYNVSDHLVLGPASLYYAESMVEPKHPTRALTQSDLAAVELLSAACPADEWEAGGSAIGENPSSGVFIGNDLVALAGYEVWDEAIAHIYIITEPKFRGHGYAQSAVAHLAGVAISSGLIPQYRTLESNRASIRIAESLGFRYYASSVAIRLR